MRQRTRSTSSTCGRGFQKAPVGRLPQRYRAGQGKPLSVLRQNLALALSSCGCYLYSGAQIDAVLTLAQDFAADGYVATRYRKGVCVQHVSLPPLEAAAVRLLNGTMSQKEWSTIQVDVVPTIG